MEMRAFIVHKVIGWLAGYVTIRLRDGEIERFVNMQGIKKFRFGMFIGIQNVTPICRYILKKIFEIASDRSENMQYPLL